MTDREIHLSTDDDHVPMTTNERAAWAYLTSVVLTTAGYLALMIGRLLHEPVAEISWVWPLVWTLVASVTGTIALTIVLTVAAIIAGARGGAGLRDAAAVADVTDVRDKEIDRRSGRGAAVVFGTGAGIGLILTMIDADRFWIGNALFVACALGAVWETTTKIRLYRRGF
ncbi:hypothetical protein [Mangrovihabitans endophyticus]|nr:hypothetical protein [Mangrovihabitans endophyticus]